MFELPPPTLGPQNHEKWRFWTPNIWVITPKNEGTVGSHGSYYIQTQTHRSPTPSFASPNSPLPKRSMNWRSPYSTCIRVMSSCFRGVFFCKECSHHIAVLRVILYRWILVSSYGWWLKSGDHHLGWCWKPINNGINYQPQLVFTPDFSHQPYHLVSSEKCFPVPTSAAVSLDSWMKSNTKNTPSKFHRIYFQKKIHIYIYIHMQSESLYIYIILYIHAIRINQSEFTMVW